MLFDISTLYKSYTISNLAYQLLSYTAKRNYATTTDGWTSNDVFWSGAAYGEAGYD